MSPWTPVTFSSDLLYAAFSSGARRPVMNTYAPSSTNRFAVARPIPLLPPVISAVLLVSLIINFWAPSITQELYSFFFVLGVIEFASL